MKILWNSSTPIGNAAYGIITKEIVRRLVKAGHFVRIATKHTYSGWHKWEGVEIFEGLNLKHLCAMIKDENFDYIFTFWDIWLLAEKRHFPHEKWIAYLPIDTEWIASHYTNLILGKDSNIKENKGPSIQIAMSKHGIRELKSIGLNPLYIPLGINTEVFKPSTEGRKAFRKSVGWEDENLFIIGSVGLNYSDDRKGFIPLMRAFKEFHKQHPEARLYLHTHAPGIRDSSIDYAQISENLGLIDYVAYPNQQWYDFNRLDENWLSNTYNGFDVFCLATRGEGFGMPIVEAQACGIPTITTDTTTGSELCKSGWLIDVDDDDLRWLPTGTWREEPRVSNILKCLAVAYSFWKNGDWKSLKKDARESVLEYDWNVVWDKYWIPALKIFEDRLKK